MNAYTNSATDRIESQARRELSENGFAFFQGNLEQSLSLKWAADLESNSADESDASAWGITIDEANSAAKLAAQYIRALDRDVA